MEIAVACLTLIVLALVAVLYALVHAHASAEDKWTVERRELCTRIQAPSRIPVEPDREVEVPEREPDDWNKVGAIEIDPEYGLGDY